MNKISLFVLLVLLFTGCASTNSYRKPGVDFSKYEKIAVIKLDCSVNQATGQEVSDMVALEFIKKGYNVLERSQLKAVIDEEVLAMAGLTESNKSLLQLSGVNAIVVGSVSRYDCHPSKAPIFYMGALLAVMNTNTCFASLSLKLLDCKTGEIIWTANGSHSVQAVGMTPHKVLQNVINTLKEDIPSRMEK